MLVSYFNIGLGIIRKDLEVDGLRVVFINQSNVRYKPVPLGLMESLLQQQYLKETNDNLWTKDKRENG
jgi:hypothetical protein